MNAQPDPYDEMQKRLREGLRILREASEEDRHRFGPALIKLHGALEDFIRLELSQKAPHLRLEVEDAGRTSWKDLLPYAKQYLEFSESDASMISEADRQCQQVARGGTYTKSRADLVRYAEFVQRRCNASSPLRDTTHLGQAATPPISGQRPGPAAAIPSTPEVRTPWYGSTWLMVAYSAILIVIFCIIGFIPYSETFMDAIQKTFQRLSLQSISAETPLAAASPTSAAVGDTKPACVIIWVEHQPDDLGKKSRATVWEQKISDEVKASGMSPREFYELVVEHNPQLIQDDYEFKKGKKYLLPECQ